MDTGRNKHFGGAVFDPLVLRIEGHGLFGLDVNFIDYHQRLFEHKTMIYILQGEEEHIHLIWKM